MVGRLQFVHDNKLYTSKEAIKAMLDVTVKDVDGKYALFAEPIVFKYGEDSADTSTWNIVLAIGKYGDGTQHSKNEYFLIDTASLEKDVAEIRDELANDSNELGRINDAITSLTERITAAEGNIEQLFGEIERVDVELAKKLEFPDLKLVYDPKSDPNNDGAIRLEWNGHTYTETQSIPIRDFIKDAMVQEANVIVKEDGNPYLHIVWNEDSEKGTTDIPLNMLVDIYTIDGGDGSTEYLRIDEHNAIHINVWDGNGYPYDGLATGSQVHDLSDSLNERIDETENNLTNRIDNVENTLNTKIDGVEDTLDDKINNVENSLNAAITSARTDLATETVARINADEDIIHDLNLLSGTVISNKTNADSEIAGLKNKDIELTNAISGIPSYNLVKTNELQYYFLVNNEVKTIIDIPKDMFIKSAEVRDGYIYIYMNALDDDGNVIYVSFPIDGLIDVYTVDSNSATYMSIDDYNVSLKVDVPNGLASYATASALDTKINNVNSGLNNSVNEIENSIDNINLELAKKLENGDLGIVYDSEQKVIKLTGKNGQLLGVIPANDFVKDGMIEHVELVDNSIVITWNTDGGGDITVIPLSGLIKIYRVAEDSQNYLSINQDTNEISIKIGNTENTLGLASYTQYKEVKDIVGDGIADTTLTREIEILKEKTDTQESGIYSPELDGNVRTPFAVGGIPTGTTVSYLSGKTMTEMFNEILFPEVYPLVATKPSVTAINGGSVVGGEVEDIVNGIALFGDELTIDAVTATVSNGKFNASFTLPAQPSPIYTTGLTLSVEYTGLKNASASAESQWRGYAGLGNNTITWTAQMNYSAPTNKPVTSFGNETTETGKTTSNGAAVWTNGSSIKTKTTTIKGVYPIFTNVAGSDIIFTTVLFEPLFSGTTSPEISVPSESISQKHFILDYPAYLRVTHFYIKDLSGNFVDFSAPYNAESEIVSHNVNRTPVQYKRLVTTGSLLGPCVYKIVFSKNMMGE